MQGQISAQIAGQAQGRRRQRNMVSGDPMVTPSPKLPSSTRVCSKAADQVSTGGYKLSINHVRLYCAIFLLYYLVIYGSPKSFWDSC